MHANILGIDIGATSVKFAALAVGEGLSGSGNQKVDAASNDVLVKQLATIIHQPEFSNCTAVGIGSPGPLDLHSGTIIASANMPNIKSCQVVELLRAEFPTKEFRLDNDANAATLGEKFFGAGKTLGDFSVFTLGTGVGGGCIFSGKLQRGFNGNFFEVGHIPIGYAVDMKPRRCGCGNEGCLETLASATGISQTYRELSGIGHTAAQIATSAGVGDKHAIEAYRVAGLALGLAAATITQLLNLTAFIFTGGVAAAEAYIRPEMVRTYQAHTFPLFHEAAQFIFTQGDESAGVLGAAALFLE